MVTDDDDAECTERENDTVIYLSDHSRSMRTACNYCVKLFQRLETTIVSASDNSNGVNTQNNYLQSLLEYRYKQVWDITRTLSEDHRNRRKEAHREFWHSPSPSSTPLCPSSDTGNFATCENSNADNQIPTSVPISAMTARLVDDKNDNKKDIARKQTLCPEQVRYFQDHFQNRNVPCLIKGLDHSPHFEFVNRKWRTKPASCNKDYETMSNCNSLSKIQPEQKTTKDDLRCNKTTLSNVNRQWFQNELGDSFIVPLRYSPHSCENNKDEHCDSEPALDEDGRAEECETRKVAISKWIEMLEMVHQEQHPGNDRSKENRGALNEKESKPIHYYLKDWHLQQCFPPAISNPPENGKFLSPCDRNSGADCALYACPEYFGHDLLNAFLTKFTSGDYRFCYWGPSQSFTARHSDVLHSFSWSYNVVGTKEWTFYYSKHPGDRITEAKDATDSDDDCNREDPFKESIDKTFTIIQETGQTIFVPATWQHRVVNLEETISINHNWMTSSNLDLVWDCIQVEMTAIQEELQSWDAGMDENMEACENMLRGCIGLDVTSFVLMTLVRVLDLLIALVEKDVDGSSCIEKECERHLFDVFRLTSVLEDALATNAYLLQLRNRFYAVLQSEDLTLELETMVERAIYWVNFKPDS